MVSPTLVAPQLLTVVLWVLVWAAIFLLAVTLGSRAGRLWRERRERQVLDELRPAMLAVASGEDDDSSALGRLTTVTHRRVRVVDRTVSTMLSKVKGEPARALARVLRAHGRADWALRGLASKRSIRRAYSAWILGLMRERESGSKIVPLLQDRSMDVVVAAARALTLLGDSKAARPVMRAVAPRRRPRGLPSWVAVESLCAFDDAVAPVVAEATAHPQPSVRHVAATVIGTRPLPRAAPVVRKRLAVEEDPRTLAALVEALGEIGGSFDLPMLSRFAQHSDETVALAAVDALEEIGLPSSVDALAPLVADTRPRLSERAAVALAELGPRGRERLRTFADAPGPAELPATYALQLVAMRSATRGLD
ncbi:HEAT repeat domain-containing protein [Kocuria sp. cx-455]|uniref:HEAT repeat domain-containing protein n=1 Tax=Kocuria sp. cx-455 TaxID=2771377 RepID=UPI001686019D|nr:HEAT repeat domain-containing protein [Kocuria sp. cx-455]MBD2763626.1 HEAT repeat domain-containing protein [Kocuria sp. cx-455]